MAVRTSSSRSPFQNRINQESHIINILLASFARSVPCFHGPRALGPRLGHKRKEKLGPKLAIRSRYRIIRVCMVSTELYDFVWEVQNYKSLYGRYRIIRVCMGGTEL